MGTTKQTRQFETIRSEGGLLPPDLLRRVLDPRGALPGTQPEDYGLAKGDRLNEAITQSWNRLRRHWAGFREAAAGLPDGEPAEKLTNDKWSIPVLQELGFGMLPTGAGPEIGGRSYAIKRFFGPTAVHLVGCGVNLDKRAAGVRGAAMSNPHGLVQEFLNRADGYLWAIVSNGLRFRILRDNQALSRQSYLEFDLEAMFDGEVYSDFVLLWLFGHATRFAAREENKPESCFLEQWTKLAEEQGTRALESLRDGVQEALQILGQGFVGHPKNTALREALRTGQVSLSDFHGELLRVVYRFIFLFVAEDRRLDNLPLLHPRNASDAGRLARERYAAFYSTRRLRDMAVSIKGGRHGDLWRQFQLVVEALSGKETMAVMREKLALPALGSLLWNPARTAHLNAPWGGEDGAELSNYDLLDAIRRLAFTRQDRTLRPVDYMNLGSEEFGSVYEGLLALTPQVSGDGASFTFAEFGGNQRKTSGSYYTADPLVQCVLDEALEPVVEERLAGKSGPAAEAALLSISVCDPAVGSGHFLIGAAHRLARHLARVRARAAGESEPGADRYQHALRDVIGHCLYGVDVNPMAAELCRVTLWIEALEPGRPLSFLDHHIRVGNSFLGTTPALVSEGLPDEAFKAIEGDDKDVCTLLRKTNRGEREGVGGLFVREDLQDAEALLRAAQTVEELPDERLEDVARKEQSFLESERAYDYQAQVRLFDAWCAAFLLLKGAQNQSGDAPGLTHKHLVELSRGGDLPADLAACVAALKREFVFFHWPLAFPRIFAQGGFDLVLGNPPWETMSPDAKEFFATFDSRVRFLKKEEQQALIAQLLESPGIADEWKRHRRYLYATVHFMKASGRYRTMFAEGNLGKGDFDLYRAFVELAMDLTRPKGAAGQVVKSGIYNGANAQGLRKELFERWEWNCVYGFLNTNEYWFPDVHPETRFALYAARKQGETVRVRTGFGLETVEGLQAALADPVVVTVESIRAQSPQTLAIPETQSAEDSALALRMQGVAPAFGNTTAGPPVRHYQREIDMGTDRSRFDDTVAGLPLMEGRMIDQFDHRAKAYRSGRGRAAIWEPLPFGHPGKAIVPQWRVPIDRIPHKLGNRTSHYRVVWCDVATPTAPRSLIAALVPPGVICGDTCPTLRFLDGADWAFMPWLAVANSVCMDYLARRKISLHLKYTHLDSLPFPRFSLGDPFVAQVGPLALRLTCTAPEMAAYWNAMAEHGWAEPIPQESCPPGIVDPAERELTKARIDALVARDVFHLSATELAFVLDSFEPLMRSETREFKEYRTRRLVLEAFGALGAEPAVAAPARRPAATATMPLSYPSNPGDEAVLGFVVQFLAGRRTAQSAELLDVLILATHPDICRALLEDDADRRRLDRLCKRVPAELFRGPNQPIRWMAARDYLERRGAIAVTDRASGGVVTLGASFDQVRARYAQPYAELIELAVRGAQALAPKDDVLFTLGEVLGGIVQAVQTMRDRELAMVA